MIEQAITISLIVTAIHVSMWDGMIFQFVREWLSGVLDIFHADVLKKPLYECLICMGGIYTLVIYPCLYGLSFQVIPTMLCVIGINTIISAIICRLNE